MYNMYNKLCSFLSCPKHTSPAPFNDAVRVEKTFQATSFFLKFYIPSLVYTGVMHFPDEAWYFA